MRYLVILYDSRCGVCTWLKGWLREQRAYFPLYLVAMQSEEARSRFPQQLLKGDDLSVVSDSGEVWIGDRAWIVCLWALRDYRSWAMRLSSPRLLPFARQAFVELSHHRLALSRMLGLRSEEDMRRYFGDVPIPTCEVDAR